VPASQLLGPAQLLLGALMLLLAIGAVETTSAELNPEPGLGLLLSYALLLPGLALTAWVMRRAEGASVLAVPQTLPPAGFACLVGLLLLPLPTELLRMTLWQTSLPLELALLTALRNLALGLALLTRWRAAWRCALAASAFMVLFSATLATGEWVRWALLSFGLLACLWLLVGYWRRLEGAEAARRFPFAIAALLLSLIAGVATLVVVGPEPLATALGSWLPSSGGDEGYSRHARSGLGDGDEVTKARSAPRSVGISESDLMLETDQPSLYDLVAEQYGPPIKNRDQAPAESQEGKKLKQDFAVAENLKVSREFPLHRQPPKPREQQSELPDALLYVQGPVPQHLRLQTYQHFDGQVWMPAELATTALPLKKKEGSNWFEIGYLEPTESDAGLVRLSVKITKLGGAVLPLPGGVTGFRLGKLTQARFFARTQGDLLCLAERDLPMGIVIDADVRTVDWYAVATVDFPARRTAFQSFQQLPESWRTRERIALLAAKWTKDVPAGWPQIQAVVAKLRSGYTLDRTYRPSASCPDALEDFLFDSRRGPDYQFATAAAVMLRTLGYPTRLVTGFYADPQRFDKERGHTFVQRDDIHTWLEVMGPCNQWFTLEPSPGYQLAESSYPWHQRLFRFVLRAWAWLAARPLGSLATIAAVALLPLTRWRLLDLATTLRWRLSPNADWRGQILATLRLVECRARWAGVPRPVGQSPGRWYGRMAAEPLGDWTNLAEWALYGPEHAPAPVSDADAWSQCRAAARQLSYRRFRQALKSLN
jgi:hypothetical protein